MFAEHERYRNRDFRPGDRVIVHRDHYRRYSEMMFSADVIEVRGKMLLLEPVDFWGRKTTLLKKTLVSFASSGQVTPELEHSMKTVKADPKAYELLKAKAQWERYSTYKVLNDYGHPCTWESYFS